MEKRKYTKRDIYEPMENKIGQDGVAEFKEDGVLATQGFETVPAINGKKAKLDALAFYNEPVTVHIADAYDENADSNFAVWVNGIPEVFWRGQEKTVKRMYVEGLARAKPVGFTSQEYMMDNGAKAYRYPSRTGMRYPFSVVEDKNPIGREWLRGVQAQP